MALRILVAWLGNNDLKAAGLLGGASVENELGPIAEGLQTMEFDELHLLCDQSKENTAVYVSWLNTVNSIKTKAHIVSLSTPIHFGEIYQALDDCLSKLFQEKSSLKLAIHLSPGTPAMAAVSILLGTTKFQAKFIQSTQGKGAVFADIPFDIAAEFIPAHRVEQDKQLMQIAAGEAPINADFADIITRNPAMKKIIDKAQAIAQRDVPALILGESGTGKELFAKAIHNASARRNKPLIVVNCGALPKDLIDSELFGHAKGAFSGAVTNKKGFFEAAHEGTIFLDEFGELPEAAQVRLLRVLQSGEFNRVGEAQTIKVDVRVIAATNRDLGEEVANGHFRMDLYYRIAIGVITLPPLREREGDVLFLADHLLNDINHKAASQVNYKNKIISVKAKKIILSYAWPGNVRELHGALLRASIWSNAKEISEEDMREALLKPPVKKQEYAWPELGKGIDILAVIEDLKEKYIQEALEKTAGNKKKAASLLGLTNYQTLTNWMEKLDLQ